MKNGLPISLATQAFAERDDTGRWTVIFDDPDSDLVPYEYLDFGIVLADTPFDIPDVDSRLRAAGLQFPFGPSWYEDPWGCGGYYASVIPVLVAEPELVGELRPLVNRGKGHELTNEGARVSVGPRALNPQTTRGSR